MKLKNVLLTSLSFVLVAAIAIGGTVAFLTSEDSDVNVMTVGEAKIDQLEKERVDMTHQDQQTPAELKDWELSALYPAVWNKDGVPVNDPECWAPGVDSDEAYVNYGTLVDADITGAHWTGVWDSSLKNVKDKMVFVKNTGDVDVYYRTIILYEYDETETVNAYGQDMIHFNINDNPRFAWTYDADYEGVDGTVEVNGEVYGLMVATYQKPLLPGTTSRPSLLQVGMDSDATNEIVEQFGDTYDILVLSQAVQTAGFDKAEAALDEGFGEITDANLKAWFGGMSIPAVVDSADELIEALENGEDVVFNSDIKIDPANMSNAYGTTGINVKNGQTVDGNGNTLNIKGAGGTWDSGINTTGGVIKNITITGSFRGVFVNHNSSHSEPVVLENVVIDGTTYTISCDQGMNQTLIARDSTFNGWTSFAATLGSATFEDCTFGQGNGYKYCRPYAPTTFVNCRFSEGYTVDPRADIVLQNCYLNGTLITQDNVSDLVSDVAKATVK